VSRFDRAMLVLAVVPAVLAALLLVRPRFVTDAWPFPGTTEVTFIFLASILAAAAASTAWAAQYGERLSYVGIALDMLVIFCPMVAYLVVLNPAHGGGLTVVLLGSIAVVLAGAWILWVSWGRPTRDIRPTPRVVLGAFGIFLVVLLLVGGALVLGTPDILPWQVTPEISVVSGLIFLGAGAYFGFGLWRRSWSNAGGQLAGFLAYDLVLIVPFVTRLSTIPDKWRISLVVYILVLVVSGAVAAWYLFIDRRTRLGPKP